VVVAAQNLNFNDVDVFLMVDGVRQRLGTVTSQGTANFIIPWSRLQGARTVWVRVDRIGDNTRYRSQPLAVRPGSQITLVVQPTLRTSSTTIY
jgi:hypothetical protein